MTGQTAALEAPEAGYDALGEFHDLFMDDPARRLRPAYEAAFAGLDPETVILDIGAGTGLGTRVLADATRAQIIAVEPSRTMRTVLTARIADDPTLTERVTVLADPVPGGFEQMPDSAAGFVCAHMLGHLTLAERAALFAGLAGLLSSDGVGIVTVDQDRAAPVEPVEQVRRIGTHRYVARYVPSSDPGGYLNVYEVRDAAGRIVRQEQFTGSWESITTDDLICELDSHGWAVEQHRPGVVFLRRPGGTR